MFEKIRERIMDVLTGRKVRNLAKILSAVGFVFGGYYVINFVTELLSGAPAIVSGVLVFGILCIAFDIALLIANIFRDMRGYAA